MISEERLLSYIKMSGGDLHKAILIYEWNTTLSETLYRPMQYLEIALRNSVHDILSAAYSRKDWYNSIDGLLKYHHLNMLGDEIVKVKKRNTDVTPGRVVAELSLGFWTGLLNKTYDAKLWIPHLHKAFPHVRVSRKKCQAYLKRIRGLRNRVAHHEPILSRDLEADYHLILKLLHGSP
jgi:hypothetical protein